MMPSIDGSSAIAESSSARSERDALVLVCRIRELLAAIPLTEVAETMRPLPIGALAHAPPFVLGLSLIRGEPVLVVDPGKLLTGSGDARPTRFVTVRAGARRLGLAVEHVLGVRQLDSASLQDLPLPLGSASQEGLSAVGAVDSDLLLLLRASRLVPDSIWHLLDEQERPA